MILEPLVKVLKTTEGLECIEVLDCIWHVEGTTLTWNTDDDPVSLRWVEEETYSGQVKVGPTFSDDGYVLITLDTECGWTVDMIFKADNEVKNFE